VLPATPRARASPDGAQADAASGHQRAGQAAAASARRAENPTPSPRICSSKTSSRERRRNPSHRFRETLLRDRFARFRRRDLRARWRRSARGTAGSRPDLRRGGPSPAASDKRAAKALMQSGLKLFAAKDFLGALARVPDRLRRFASAKILLNIGTTLSRLDRKAQAANVYQRSSTRPTPTPPSTRTSTRSSPSSTRGRDPRADDSRGRRRAADQRRRLGARRRHHRGSASRRAVDGARAPRRLHA